MVVEGMQLTRLELENVGPFDAADIHFQQREEGPGVTILTGDNGTGKSVVLDAIRHAMGRQWVDRKTLRSLRRATDRLSIRLHDSHGDVSTQSSVEGTRLKNLPQQSSARFAADYWQSALATDSYAIQSLDTVMHPRWLKNSLDGRARNAATTQLFCYFDYLRDSRDTQEKAAGERVWEALTEIVASAVPSGELREVRRSSFQPVVRQYGRDLPLEQLSAGSLYVIGRMVRLLGRMYSCAVVRGMPEDEVLTETPGLLLIDEAENHLHPKWQKRFLPDILRVFPNLQIIVATHSPFIVSSVAGARVLRCRALDTSCIIEDVSADYAHQPVDEVLASEAFSETAPYSTEVDALVQQRRNAIREGNEAERERVEQQLVRLNPDAFGAFRVAEILKELGEAS